MQQRRAETASLGPRDTLRPVPPSRGTPTALTANGGAVAIAGRRAILSSPLLEPCSLAVQSYHRNRPAQTRLQFLPAQLNVHLVWQKISTGGRLSVRCRMEDEDDEVSRPVARCWGAPFREVKYVDVGTQTPWLTLGRSPREGLLPCSGYEVPRRLFYGNAGFRLHFPALFEHVGGREMDWRRDQILDQDQRLEQDQREELQDQPELSSEVRIGRNLQLIGDQFHQERVQLYQRTQRNQRAGWWQLVMSVFYLLFHRGGVAHRQRGVLR
ncbi:hypothetical protein GJAV_G00108480 [Gymnothorax javanicus]|nr:hypothetical protein GJAV_G00108480 [Gymnothorax javanicus]